MKFRLTTVELLPHLVQYEIEAPDWQTALTLIRIGKARPQYDIPDSNALDHRRYLSLRAVRTDDAELYYKKVNVDEGVPENPHLPD